MSDPLVLTSALGGSPLARAAQGDAPPAWFPAAPSTAVDWQRHARAVAEDADAQWLRRIAPALPSAGPAADRLARSAHGGIVITTGQQAGLFGGPIYTWSKALAAQALAEELERICGVPVATVFWAATDDSDFAEAATTHVAVEGGVRALTLPASPMADVPMADVAVGDVADLIDQLRHATGAAVDTEVIDLVERCYGDSATVGSAYVALLRVLLGERGIAVLDSAQPSVSDAARPLLQRALDGARDVERALARRDGELRAAGFEPQVAQVEGLSLVFARVEGQRVRMPVDEARRASLVTSTDTLSANVLLRPVAERAILPTAAYVAGPGELAYFAQVSAVAEALGARVPVAVPRWSGTILEPHIQRLLRRYELDMDDLLDPHAAEGRLARRALAPGTRAAIADVRENVRASLDVLARALPLSADLPPDVVRGAERDMLRRIERLERRIVAAVKRRESRMVRDLGTLRGALQPYGRPQERVLNMIPMLARHGRALFDAMYEQARGHARRLIGAEAASPSPVPVEERGDLRRAPGRA